MGKLIMVLALAAGGWAAYWYGFHQSEPYKAYLQFRSVTRKGNCPKMEAMVEGQAQDWMEQFCGYGKYSGKPSPAKMVAEMSGSPGVAMQGLKHRIESEQENEDGSVSLVVIEHLVARPSDSRDSTAPATDSRHSLKLRLVGEAWKLSEWVETEVPQ